MDEVMKERKAGHTPHELETYSKIRDRAYAQSSWLQSIDKTFFGAAEGFWKKAKETGNKAVGHEEDLIGSQKFFDTANDYAAAYDARHAERKAPKQLAVFHVTAVPLPQIRIPVPQLSTWAPFWRFRQFASRFSPQLQGSSGLRESGGLSNPHGVSGIMGMNGAYGLVRHGDAGRRKAERAADAAAAKAALASSAAEKARAAVENKNTTEGVTSRIDETNDILQQLKDGLV